MQARMQARMQALEWAIAHYQLASIERRRIQFDRNSLYQLVESLNLVRSSFGYFQQISHRLRCYFRQDLRRDFSQDFWRGFRRTKFNKKAIVVHTDDAHRRCTHTMHTDGFQRCFPKLVQ